MVVERDTIGIGKPLVEGGSGEEGIVVRDNWAIACADAANLTHDPVSLVVAVKKSGVRAGKHDLKREQGFLQCKHVLLSGLIVLHLVQDAEHRDDILVLRLRDEFRQDANVIERPLRVHVTSRSPQEIGLAKSSGMVPPVLRSRDSVQIEVDPETVFTRPLDGLEEVAAEQVR